MKIIATIAAALIATTATADMSPKPYEVTDHWANGGNIKRAMNEDVLRLGNEQLHIPVQITGPFCASTCTLFLGIPRTCVDPKTVFYFHGPQARWAVFASVFAPMPFSGMSAEDAEWFRHHMGELYNHGLPGLGDWFRGDLPNFSENPSKLAGVAASARTGQWLHDKFGANLCETEAEHKPRFTGGTR